METHSAGRSIRVILCGVGGVGRNVVRLSRQRSGLSVVAAWSRDATLQGRDLGELAGLDPSGVSVSAMPEALATPADLLLIATTSFLRDVEADIRAGIKAGLNVMVTAEEMAFPWTVDASIASSIDAAATSAGVTVVGAGANPGYIYEVVGLALAGAVWRVDRIGVRRIVDLSGFSAGVQRRLGIGFEPDEFRQRVADHLVFGHIGFPHTIRTFARRLGVEVERIEETIEPILAGHQLDGTAVPVPADWSAGLHQHTTGIVAGKPWFAAEFIGHIDPAGAGLEPQDSYQIDGLPNVRAMVAPGFNPQWTTAGALANLMPLVVAAPAGLLSVTDLPIPSPWR